MRRLRTISPRKALATAGAVAAALGSIIALGTTVGDWFKAGPEGSVTSLRLQPLQTLTYKEWRQHEEVPINGVPESQRKILGKMITYDLETAGYAKNTELPVRIILHETGDRRRLKIVHGDVVKVAHGRVCGCFDWIAIPGGRAKYYIEVAVFPPGAITGQPLKTAATPLFPAPTV